MTTYYSEGSIQVRALSNDLSSEPNSVESIILPYQITEVVISFTQSGNGDSDNLVTYKIIGLGHPGSDIILSDQNGIYDQTVVDEYGYFEFPYSNPQNYLSGLSLIMSIGDLQADYQVPDISYPLHDYVVEDGTNNLFITRSDQLPTSEISRYSFDGGRSWTDWDPDSEGRVAVPEGVYSSGSILTKSLITTFDGSTKPGLIYSSYSVISPFACRNINKQLNGSTWTVTGSAYPLAVIDLQSLTAGNADVYGKFSLDVQQSAIIPGIEYSLCINNGDIIGCVPITFP